MNRTILNTSLALFLSAGLVAHAQQTPAAPDSTQQPSAAWHHHRHPSPQREAAMLSRRLNLTPDQTSRLEPILADRDQKLATLKSNTALSEQDFKQQRHAIQADTMQQFQSVLTPEQLDQMKAMHHRGPRGQNQNQPAPAPGV
jgi:protein CpxP